MPSLFGFDLTGKQRYIFATNTLREIIGASSIMDRINKEFAEKFESETIYSGGGNGTAFFTDPVRLSAAKEYLVSECSGNGIACFFSTVETDREDYAAYEKLKAEMAEKKRRGVTPAPGMFMPHSDLCSSCMTRNAVAKSGDRKLCFVCSAKIDAAEKAHVDIIKEMGLNGSPEKWFMMDLNEDIVEFNKKDGLYSLIAIVKMDGNALGKKLLAFMNKNRDDLRKMGFVSVKLDEAARKSVARACGEVFKDQISAGRKLPFRPIIIGGDDIAFTIAPRYAFEFTRKVSEYFTENTRNIGLDSPVTISAGIVFTHASFPMVKSIELAEDLLSSAKKHGLRLDPANPPAMADFQVLLGSLNNSIEDIRKRECTIVEKDKSVTELWQKPYLLYENSRHAVETLAGLTAASIRFGGVLKRSKLKKLREVFQHCSEDRDLLLKQIKKNIKGGKDSAPIETFENCIAWASKNASAFKLEDKRLRLGAPDLIEIFDIVDISGGSR